MSSDNIAISVRNLSKCYEIYDSPRDRLKQFIVPRLQSFSKQDKKYYQEFWAIRNVSFDVQKGETVGIIGRNGSGKSTLLQMICGTLHPSCGKVETHGRIAALLELGTGFNFDFTGRENIYMNASILGVPFNEIHERFDDIASFADIGDFIEQPVKSYSSGMIVRLAFAVQAMINPDILIVDEALAVGDEKFQRKCFGRLEQLRNNGTSILFVSHSGEQIIELCERVLLLERGERLMYAKPTHVVRAYQKLIYAPRDKQDQLIKEFREQECKSLYENKSREEQRLNIDIDTGEDDFDPGLVPETTNIYPTQGACIDKVRILNDEGREVNLLRSGHHYRFVMSGRFQSNAENVHFGIHIRTISGVVVTGQRHPEEGSVLGPLQEGNNFEISFSFRMTLLPGVYFVGGGVWKDHGQDCLHRILDMLMFRIVTTSHQSSFGYYDASSNEPDLKVF